MLCHIFLIDEKVDVSCKQIYNFSVQNKKNFTVSCALLQLSYVKNESKWDNNLMTWLKIEGNY